MQSCFAHGGAGYTYSIYDMLLHKYPFIEQVVSWNPTRVCEQVAETALVDGRNPTKQLIWIMKASKTLVRSQVFTMCINSAPVI